MRNYFLAQSVTEIDFILKKKGLSPVCIPLNLEQLLYCKERNIEFLDLNWFLDNNIHKKCLIESEKIINNLKIYNLKQKNLKLEFIGILRFRLNLIIFIDEIIKKLKKMKMIDFLIFSGWIEINSSSKNSYFLYHFADFFKKKIKIIILKKKIFSTNFLYNYKINCSVNNKTKNILLNNLGYNFVRFLFINIIKKYNFYFYTSNNISYFKQKFLSFFNTYSITSSKEKLKNKNLNKIKFNFNLNKKSKIIYTVTKIMNDYNMYFNNLINFQNNVSNFLNNNNFDLIISNIFRGLEGSFAYEGFKKKIVTLCLPHGTISNHFNKLDKIYKKIIAEGVFSGKFKYIAIQSKIFKKSLVTHKISGKAINTGNLIFANNFKINFFKKKYALYAVTLKDLYNMQVLGVDLFYEFYQNLENLNKLSAEKKITIVVNIHQSHSHLKERLKTIFKNLIFKNCKIDELLSNSYVVITYSSTVVEDALNSRIPVILFDPRKKYKHCEVDNNSSSKNCLFYITNYFDLANRLILLKNKNINKKNNFKNYVFLKNPYFNIIKLLNKLI